MLQFMGLQIVRHDLATEQEEVPRRLITGNQVTNEAFHYNRKYSHNKVQKCSEI